MANERALHVALQFLQDKLQNEPGLSEPGQPDFVNVKSIVNGKGEINLAAGEVGLMLVNIEEEKHLKPQQVRERRVEDSVSFSNPEIYLNLYILVAANPGDDNYLAALDRLSLVMEFFQGTSWFNDVQIPGSDFMIEKIMMDLFTLSFEQQNQLWASLGAKYIPSVIYKARMVVVDQKKFGDEQMVIKEIETDLKRI